MIGTPLSVAEARQAPLLAPGAPTPSAQVVSDTTVDSGVDSDVLEIQHLRCPYHQRNLAEPAYPTESPVGQTTSTF
jgi:hypothetical protein